MESESPSHPDATILMNAAADGDADAAERLLSLVYEQLKKTAQLQMAAERPDHTLTATALVHEAWLRLTEDNQVAARGRAYFFSSAAEAMRRILVEHARARSRLKRGGDAEGRPARRVPIEVLDLADPGQDPGKILMLDEALRRLETEDAKAARVVQLRFFAGLSGDAVAAVLGVSPSAVDREWAFARARLFRLMKQLEGD